MLGLIIPLSHITFSNLFFNVCLQTSGDYSHILILMLMMRIIIIIINSKDNNDDNDNNNNNNKRKHFYQFFPLFFQVVHGKLYRLVRPFSMFKKIVM